MLLLEDSVRICEGVLETRAYCHDISEQDRRLSRMHAAVRFAFARLYHVHVHNKFKKQPQRQYCPPHVDIVMTECLLRFVLPPGPFRNPLGAITVNGNTKCCTTTCSPTHLNTSFACKRPFSMFRLTRRAASNTRPFPTKVARFVYIRPNQYPDDA
jgi:hypothetical protein